MSTMPTETSTATVTHPRAWNMAMVDAGARHRGDTPEDQLVATFDVFHEVYRRADRNAREFTELLAGAAEVADFDSVITTLANDARLDDVASLVTSWRMLAHGSARSFVDGNHDAGLEARQMASDLVVRHRPSLKAFSIDVSLDSENQHSFDSMEWN